MDDRERKVIEFLVKDIKKKRQVQEDELETPSFDCIYEGEEPSYELAVEYARAYCSFYENPSVREARRLSRKIKDMEKAVPHLVRSLYDSCKEDFITNLVSGLKGLVICNHVKKSDGVGYTDVYTRADGSPVGDSKVVSFRPNQIILSYAESKTIRPFYLLFADQYLWIKLVKVDLEYNAKLLVPHMTKFIQLLELAIQIDAQYPFAEEINGERAIVMGIKCDLEKDDIQLVLALPGGSLRYLSSKHISSEIGSVGKDAVEVQEISQAQLEALGLDASMLPQKSSAPVSVGEESGPQDFIPNHPEEKYDINQQFQGFNDPYNLDYQPEKKDATADIPTSSPDKELAQDGISEKISAVPELDLDTDQPFSSQYDNNPVDFDGGEDNLQFPPNFFNNEIDEEKIEDDGDNDEWNSNPF